MTARPRGVYPAACEQCGAFGPCILRQVGNRYLWSCIAGCAVHVKDSETR